jgi:hypothetical protein
MLCDVSEHAGPRPAGKEVTDMHRLLASITLMLLVAGLILPGFAQTPQPAPAAGSTAPAPGSTGSATPPAPAKPAQATTAPAAPSKPATAAKKPVTKTVMGTVKSATADSLVLVTTGKDKKTKEWTFVLDHGTKIHRAAKTVDAKALAEKDTARVSYREAQGKMIATDVAVRPAKKKS